MEVFINVPGVYDPTTHRIDMTQTTAEDLRPAPLARYQHLLQTEASLLALRPYMVTALNQSGSAYTRVQGGGHGDNDLAGKDRTKLYTENYADAQGYKDVLHRIKNVVESIIAMTPFMEDPQWMVEATKAGWVNPS